MTLQIVELNNSLKNLRLAPRSGGLERPANGPALTWPCANRYGVAEPPARPGTGPRLQPRDSRAAFARLGR